MLKLFSAFLFFPFALSSQSIFFELKYGASGNDWSRSVKEFSNGTIFTAGFTDSGSYAAMDISLSKIDQYGNVIWTKFYGDNYSNYGLFLNTTADGNLVICGETQTALNQIDAFLYKIDTAGNLLWSKYYSSPLNESVKHVFQTSDGGFFLTGFQNDAFGYNDSYVIKTDASGNMVWDMSFGGADNDYADKAKETPEGNFIITGDTKSFGAGGYDVQIVKCNPAGIVIWDFTYGNNLQNGCQGIYITADNKYISYGETEISTFSPFDFFIEKIDTAGASIWRQTFGGALSDAAFGLTELPDKGFMLTGYTNNYPQPGPLNLVVIRTDSLASVQWIQAYGGSGIDMGYEIIPSVLGGFLICGVYSDTLNFDSEFYLLHVDNAGLLSSVTEEENQNSFSVFPNPSSGIFTIKMEDVTGKMADLEIYNVLGEQIFTSRISYLTSHINLSNQVPGIYFLKIVDGKSTYSRKLIIQKTN